MLGRLRAASAALARRGLASSSGAPPVAVHNPAGSLRVVVTKDLPGTRWLDVLTSAGCRVEVCTSAETILPVSALKALIGSRCDGVVGQLTERWDAELFGTLRAAGGTAYSNYAVGYDNVKVADATEAGVAVGNTPGVLTETTAETAAALTLAAARRIPEADVFMRAGRYAGWLPTLFVGKLLQGATVGIVGAGRIGAAYARMMAEGHKCHIVYFDPYPNAVLEGYLSAYGALLASRGEPAVTVRRAATLAELLAASDVVSLHCALDAGTRHLIDAKALRAMKKDAVLVNCARGPVVDEAALVAHLQANPEFRCGLDVFEYEPAMAPGLAGCPNAVIVPHIASASAFTRGGMATLAAANVAARLKGWPVWGDANRVAPFLEGDVSAMPKAAPSIVNAKQLGLATL